MSLKPWKIRQTEVLLDRRPWMRILADDVELPDGRVVEGYLRLETSAYIMVVPLDTSGRVGLVRSYKHGVRGIDMQPPAGIVEPGEAPLEAAQRELLEETGCRAEAWQSLGSYVLGGNYGGGPAHLYLATGCRPVAEPDPGDLEEQEVVWLPLAEARKQWQAGDFRQIGAAAALGLALGRLEPPGTHGP